MWEEEEKITTLINAKCPERESDVGLLRAAVHNLSNLLEVFPATQRRKKRLEDVKKENMAETLSVDEYGLFSVGVCLATVFFLHVSELFSLLTCDLSAGATLSYFWIV